jgi:hypothetical protein
MRRTRSPGWRAAALAIFLVACQQTATMSEALVADGGGDPNACAEPGALGNEFGVGEYCTRVGGECNDNEGALFCTADYGKAPTFCTKPCATAGQCGANAVCIGELDGGSMGCVPSCVLETPDGGQ